MKILWLTWKDLTHPLAGGAEVVNEEIARRLAADGHKVTLIVGGYKGASSDEMVNGYRVIRLGSRYTVHPLAYRYYKKHLRGWADLVIDEVNTMPFFARLYVKEPSVVLAYMLCRNIWFYQMSFPLSLLGYLSEPAYLRLLRGSKVLTESESSKHDLQRHGFRPENIHIFRVGIEIDPVPDLRPVQKFKRPTLLSLGSIRAMKRTAHQIRAFELAKRRVKNLQLKIAGSADDAYGRKVLKMIASSPYAKDIEYLGKVTREQKIELMRKSHLIMVTSVKEGWGLIVTEAASQGTPAVVYDVDGLRDSVRNGNTGIVCARNTPGELARNIAALLKNRRRYNILRSNAWQWSKEITHEQSYRDFKEIIGLK